MGSLSTKGRREVPDAVTLSGLALHRLNAAAGDFGSGGKPADAPVLIGKVNKKYGRLMPSLLRRK